MTDFVFHSFFECEDGRAARLETAKMGIPVNVFAEESTDFDLRDGEACKAELFGVGSRDTEVYPNEAAFKESGSNMAVPSMIPAGTFPAKNGDEDFEESPWIIYVGTVKEVDTDPEAGPDQPNYCLTVETLEMTVTVYLHYDGPIEPGYILHGTAWLFADVTERKYGNAAASGRGCCVKCGSKTASKRRKTAWHGITEPAITPWRNWKRSIPWW